MTVGDELGGRNNGLSTGHQVSVRPKEQIYACLFNSQASIRLNVLMR
jgi:hypothetical protein